MPTKTCTSWTHGTGKRKPARCTRGQYAGMRTCWQHYLSSLGMGERQRARAMRKAVTMRDVLNNDAALTVLRDLDEHDRAAGREGGA